MKLPEKTTKPKTGIAEQSILLYGAGKIGKSTFASQFPDALFLATEAGLNHLEAYQLPITSWEDMLEACRLVSDGKHQFQTIVIDTIDNMYRHCADYICKKNNVDILGDIGWGKGPAKADNEFFRVVQKLTYLPYGLVLISHSTTIDYEKDGIKTTKIVPSLPPKTSPLIIGLVDTILYCDIMRVRGEGEDKASPRYERVIRTAPSKKYYAGSRTNTLTDTIPLQYDVYAGYVDKAKGGKK